MKKYSKVLFLITAVTMISSCTVAPLTGRRQLKLVSDESVAKSTVAQYREFINDASSKNLLANNTEDGRRLRQVGGRISAAVEKYMNEIPKKYNDPVIIALSKIFVARDFNEKQKLTEKVLNLLKSESERKKVGVSDEEYYLMKLTYYLNKIRGNFDRGEVKQAVAEYLNNIVNDDVSEEIRNYNLRAEVILYFNVVIMNEEIKEDLLKISNGAKLEDTWIAKKIQKETEKDRDFLSKMVN